MAPTRTRRSGGKGYRMRTGALKPQRANETGSRCGHRKKTGEAKEISKAKASKAKAFKAKASKSKSKPPEPKTTTKTKTKASKAPAALLPIGTYADG